MLNAILQINFEEEEGDILAFLTGQVKNKINKYIFINVIKEDIEELEVQLKEKNELISDPLKKLNICTMYSALPSKLQLKAFEKSEDDLRKVVLATNIAETSITIDGIKYVIDSGLVKIRKYNPNKDIESLVVVPISQSSALQRFIK